MGSNGDSDPYSSYIGLDGAVEQGVLKSIMNGSTSSSCSIFDRAIIIVGYKLLVDKQADKGAGRSSCNIWRLLKQ